MSEAHERRVLRAYAATHDALDEAPGADARAAILAAAARNVGSRPAAAGRAVGRGSRWRVPLATAASVLVGTIAVLLATRIEQEPPEPASTAPAATMAAAPAAPRRAAAEADAANDKRRQEAPAQERRAAAPREEVEGAAKPFADKAPVIAADEASARPSATATAPAAAAPPAPARRIAEPESRARENVAREAATLAKSTDKADQRMADTARDSVRPAAAPAGAGTVAEAERPAPTAVAGRMASGVRSDAETTGAAAPVAGAASAARLEVGKAKAQADAEPAWRSTIPAWIEKIIALRAQGEHEKAEEELALLRQRHPDQRLPSQVFKDGRDR